MNYLEFVEWGYKPSPDELICLFRVEPSRGFSFDEAVGRVASESSNGTWTRVFVSEEVRKLGAKAYEKTNGYVKIAYPVALFEPGNMPQILSSIAGNIFGMKAVANLRLEDVYWPPKIVKTFKGPKHGINGVRETLKVKNRPLTATVPKPKVGMTPDEHSWAAYEIWVGGVDIVKDDENLTSQRFNRFKERVEKTLRMREKAEGETGERKCYMPNISAETSEMIKRAKAVKDLGGEYVMIDILTCGWASLQTIRERNEELNLILHAHRAFHAAFTRNPRHGMSMKVVAEAARLVGVDQLHVGTVVGKLESPLKDVAALINILREEKINENMDLKLLNKNWQKLKSVLPVSSGGLHPGLIPEVMKIFGVNVLIQVGGGVLGHPDGPRSGAAAVRQAVEAVSKCISLEEYAVNHKELRRALEKWGHVKPK